VPTAAKRRALEHFIKCLFVATAISLLLCASLQKQSICKKYVEIYAHFIYNLIVDKNYFGYNIKSKE
jgi:hypothetical protein